MRRLLVVAVAVIALSEAPAARVLAAEADSGGSPRGASDGHPPAPEPRHEAPRAPPESSALRPFKRLWIGAGAELELMELPSAGDACALNPTTGLPTNGSGLYCTTVGGSDFPDRSVPLENAGLCTAAEVTSGVCSVHAGGRSHPGLARGNLRLTASVDYAVTANLLIGARIGVSFFPYPGQVAVNDRRQLGSRFYGEARGTWVFGANALGSPGIKPLVLLGVGAAEFDARSPSAVAFCPSAQSVVSGKRCQVPLFTGPVDVWQTNGPGFGTLGAGLRWLATPSIALTVALRVNLTFHENGLAPSFVPFVPTFGPELAAQYGF
jgi:hypothetical protein